MCACVLVCVSSVSGWVVVLYECGPLLYGRAREFACLFVRTQAVYYFRIFRYLHNMQMHKRMLQLLNVRGVTGGLLRGIASEVVRGRAICFFSLFCIWECGGGVSFGCARVFVSWISRGASFVFPLLRVCMFWGCSTLVTPLIVLVDRLPIVIEQRSEADCVVQRRCHIAQLSSLRARGNRVSLCIDSFPLPVSAGNCVFQMHSRAHSRFADYHAMNNPPCLRRASYSITPCVL